MVRLNRDLISRVCGPVVARNEVSAMSRCLQGVSVCPLVLLNLWEARMRRSHPATRRSNTRNMPVIDRGEKSSRPPCPCRSPPSIVAFQGGGNSKKHGLEGHFFLFLRLPFAHFAIPPSSMYKPAPIFLDAGQMVKGGRSKMTWCSQSDKRMEANQWGG